MGLSFLLLLLSLCASIPGLDGRLRHRSHVFLSPLNLIGTPIDVYKGCSVGDAKGRCVFSLACMFSGGISIGICREKFLFGSCCQLKYGNDNVVISVEEGNGLEPVISEEDPTSILPTQICGQRYEDFTTPEGQSFKFRFLPPAQGRLIGGEPSRFGAWPWQISLRILASDGSSTHRCGAVLIAKNWAVTAAHCIYYYDLDEILLRIGDHNRVSEDEPLPHVDRKPAEVFIHPDYQIRTFESDLALIYFQKPVPFLPHIRPICLPSQGQSVVGKRGFATGWGEIYEEGPRPRILHEVSLPIIDHKQCTDYYSKAGLDELVTKVFICAGEEEGGKDSCEGDSGGPLVIKSEATGRWVLAGITSWGRGCGERFQPGVYTRVPYFIDWIHETIKPFVK